ncbi:hypothetical protein H5410_047592 [Solanum commersonii]|uniref:Uncharacterized protein n=1 Tax=Solanum commersonii TaxID=4109 RepID=A0A9J5XJ44_SOLCO|nr:hypothetical protein H5410_047592 [Solanum commersonii]
MGKQMGYQTNSISNLKEIRDMEKQLRKEREEDVEIEASARSPSLCLFQPFSSSATKETAMNRRKTTISGAGLETSTITIGRPEKLRDTKNHWILSVSLSQNQAIKSHLVPIEEHPEKSQKLRKWDKNNIKNPIAIRESNNR